MQLTTYKFLYFGNFLSLNRVWCFLKFIIGLCCNSCCKKGAITKMGCFQHTFKLFSIARAVCTLHPHKKWHQKGFGPQIHLHIVRTIPPVLVVYPIDAHTKRHAAPWTYKSFIPQTKVAPLVHKFMLLAF